MPPSDQLAWGLCLSGPPSGRRVRHALPDADYCTSRAHHCRNGSVPMSMVHLVARNGRRLRRQGLRQLLAGFLQPPLISRRIHDVGRPAPGQYGFAGNDHREADRSCRQDILHVWPTISTGNRWCCIHPIAGSGTVNDAGKPANAKQLDPGLRPGAQHSWTPEAEEHRGLRSITAGTTARCDRCVDLARGSDHLDALAGRILRRDLFVLDARRSNHDRLRDHHSAISRRSAVRDDTAGRHHDGLLNRAVLRRDHLPLIAGGAGLRRRVAIGASRCRRTWGGHHRRGYRNGQSCKNA